MTGANTYSGGTNINAGTAIISKDNSFGTGQATFATGTALTTAAGVTVSNLINLAGDATLHSSTHDSSLNGVISGAGSLTKDGSGSVSLNGANEFLGGITVSEGRVVATKDKSLGEGQAILKTGTALETASSVVLKNSIQLAGDSTIDTRANNSSIYGIINGIGSLTKAGIGSLTLSGVNTYTGKTLINAGKVIINNDQSLGQNNQAQFAEGTSLETTVSIRLATPLTLVGNTTLRTLNNSQLDLAGSLSGAGRLNKEGDGSLIISGSNSNINGISVIAGTLIASTDDSLGAASATLKLDGGSFQSSTSTDYKHAIELGVNHGIINTQNNNVNISGLVSGVGKLNKAGAGVLTLTGNNTYSGGTVINEGTVAVANASNLGTGSINLQNGTLQAQNDLTLNQTISVGTNATLDSAGHQISTSGIISGSGSLVKIGAGNLELTGSNTYSGDTFLRAGTLILNTGSNLGTGNLQLQGGTLALKSGFVSTKTLTQGTTSGTFVSDSIVTGQGSFSNTVINSGALIVNGTLTSPITIGKGGILRGNGKVIGNTVVAGILEPGNSPGILNIDGNKPQPFQTFQVLQRNESIHSVS